MIILLPTLILYTTWKTYPEIWSTYLPRPYKYYSSKFELIPRRNQSDFDKKAENGERVHSYIEEESDKNCEGTDSESDEEVYIRKTNTTVAVMEHHMVSTLTPVDT